jgi:hypothetical protein
MIVTSCQVSNKSRSGGEPYSDNTGLEAGKIYGHVQNKYSCILQKKLNYLKNYNVLDDM